MSQLSVATDPSGPVATDRTIVPARWLVGAGTLVAVVRWWTSHDRNVFHLTPDEPGQLAIARFVSGMGHWNMFDRSTWRPGYGTLLAPLHWLTSDPVVAFRGALIVNALLGGIACVLLCRLAGRLTPLSPRMCVAAAVAVALAPAVLFTTNLVWSEALVAVTFLATLLALLRFHDVPSIARGAAVVVLAPLGFLAHSRLLPLVVVAVVLFVVEAVRRWVRWPAALGFVAGTIALTWLAAVYSSWLVQRIWEAPRDTNTIDGVLSRLTAPASVTLSAVGQVWYQLVVTVGFAGVGAVALIVAMFRRAARPHPAPAAARIAGATIAPLIALSIVFMSDRLRPDRVVYGRYNDAILGPLVLAGIGAVVTMRRRALAATFVGVVAAVVVGAAVLVVWRDEALSSAGAVRTMVLGLAPWSGGAAGIEVVDLTVSALVVMALVAGGTIVARTLRRPAAAALVLIPLLAVGYVRTAEVADRTLDSWALPDVSLQRLREALPPDQPVRFRLVPDRDRPAASWSDQRMRTMVYQFYLPTNPMSVDGPETAELTSYVFAPTDDAELRDEAADVLWRDPEVRVALWLEH